MDTNNLLPDSETVLPPGTHRIELHVEAVDLDAPRKVRVQYRLDGVDGNWLDASASRTVVYTNVPIGSHAFHVRASSSDGIWDRTGIVYNIEQLPYFYQRTWFLVACVAAFLAVLWGMYQLRLRQLSRQFNLHLEGRVAERTRIARELHDTLLQSFQGVLLKFHAVTYQLSDRPELQRTLEGVIGQARQAVTEGRDAVQGLRSSIVVTNDLARAIRTLCAELADKGDVHAPVYRVNVEGTPRDLEPILRDDIYRIAGEAVRNAFQHAHAGSIEVQIQYDHRQLRLRIRDDGEGIDPKVLESGARAGHYGLPGLQERAKLVSGKLTVWSDPGTGTEIELTIPASVVYAASGGRRAILRGKSAS